ncbi:SUN domain-containing protein [Plasmodiophora brassicae]
MAAGLLGLVVACALLTDRQSAGADTVTWKMEAFGVRPSRLLEYHPRTSWWSRITGDSGYVKDTILEWAIFDVQFNRCGPDSTSETMLCRHAYRSGASRGASLGSHHNISEVPHLFALSDNGKYWTRFEFDVLPEGDPMPSDIKIVFEHMNLGPAKSVTLSMEYKQCEYVVYSNLTLDGSKYEQEIYIKRDDVLKSVYRTSAETSSCKLLAETTLAGVQRQVDEQSSTVKHLEEESSKQKHALQTLTNERSALHAADQRRIIANLTGQVMLLERTRAVLRNATNRQASEIANLTSHVLALDNLAAQAARLSWQRKALAAGLFASAGAAAAMGWHTVRHSRPAPTNNVQIERPAVSKPLLMGSLATAAAGIGLAARYASRAEPGPIGKPRRRNLQPLPRLYVAPEYRLPIIAVAVTVALAVLLVSLAFIYNCSSRRDATDQDLFNA